MGMKPFNNAYEKLQIVLSVLRGEMTQVEAARRLQMSQTTIAKWQKQFGEACDELNVWRKKKGGGLYPPSRTSRRSG